MLKKQPRDFWMLVDLIGFLLGLLLLLFLSEYNKIDGFMSMDVLNKLVILYCGLHTIMLAIHGVYILATTDKL